MRLFYKGDEEYYTLNESENRVEIDMLAREQKRAQSPMELLLSALISCAAVDLVSMVRKRRKTFIDLRGEVSGVRREEHPRKYVNINIHYTIISPDLTESEAERLVELAVTKYCSVAGTIDPNTKMTHTFSIERG